MGVPLGRFGSRFRMVRAQSYRSYQRYCVRCLLLPSGIGGTRLFPQAVANQVRPDYGSSPSPTHKGRGKMTPYMANRKTKLVYPTVKDRQAIFDAAQLASAHRASYELEVALKL